MTLILGGRKHDTTALPGALAFTSYSYADDRRVPRATDYNERDPTRDRDTAILGLLFHTVHGRRGALRPGSKPDDRDFSFAQYQARTERDVSWDFTVGRDGDVVQSNDPATRYTWHAGLRAVNRATVGVEAVQDDDGGQYEATMAAQVALAEFLCEWLHIPRVTPVNADGTPFAGLLADPIFRGVYGHRNIPKRGPNGKPTAMKPFGDPGDHVFLALLRAGFRGAIVEVRNGLGYLTNTFLDGETLRAESRVGNAVVSVSSGAHATPRTPPAWLDKAREVPLPQSAMPGAFPGRTDAEMRAFAERHARVLHTTFRLPLRVIVQVVAHAATESAWGRVEVAHNAFGVKVRQSDDAAYRAKHGQGLAWYSRPGHVAAGDAAWVYYRGFDSPEDAWAFWLKRYVPRPANATTPWAAYTDAADVTTADYSGAGRAFWSAALAPVGSAATPYPPEGTAPEGAWFVEMLLAGYRGSGRAAEVRDAVEDAETRGIAALPIVHPSVTAHADVCRRVRGYLAGIDLGA